MAQDLVKIRDISLFEIVGNYTRVYFKDKKPMLYKSLNQVEEKLPVESFFRANRQQIVNTNYIENVVPWFNGKCVLDFLETVQVDAGKNRTGARLPVQWVCRPDGDFRGFAGTVAGAALKPGDAVRIEPDGAETRIESIEIEGETLTQAVPGQAVMVTLKDNVDVARGDVIRHAESAMQTADQVQAHVVWVSDNPMIPGRQYHLKLATAAARAARVARPRNHQSCT